MSHHHAPPYRSPWPLRWLAGLLVSALAVIAWARWAGWTQVGQEAPVVWTRALNFQDHASGAVLVVDAATGLEIARFEGEQGFLRGTLRALIRERKRRDLGSVDPFYLQGHQDGRMTLRDPGTGTRIPLDSFGPSQLALFLPLRDTPVAVSVRISGETP